MANDSPAKSLVDIDLASLRVSVLHSDIFTLAFTLFLPQIFFNKKIQSHSEAVLLLTQPYGSFSLSISAGMRSEPGAAGSCIERTRL